MTDPGLGGKRFLTTKTRVRIFIVVVTRMPLIIVVLE